MKVTKDQKDALFHSVFLLDKRLMEEGLCPGSLQDRVIS